MDRTKIDHDIQYREATETEKNLINKINVTGKQLILEINDFLDDGREKSLAITKIEEALLWAEAGIKRAGI